MSDPGNDIAQDKAAQAHRTSVNLAAAIAVLLLAIAMVYIFGLLDAQRKLQRCLDSGRRDCISVPQPPKPAGSGALH